MDSNEHDLGRLVLSVPEAGRLVGLGRTASYDAARRGEIPTLKLGSRLVVPRAKWLALLGVADRGSAA
jgi:hypothetical protein